MKQLLIATLIIVASLTACKKKETNTAENPSTTASPMDKLPDASTGWNIAPCKLIDEDYLRKALKIEDIAIGLIPNVAQNNQGVSSCIYRWMKPDFQAIEISNNKLKEVADKKKQPFTPQSTLNVIVISYTGKYADAKTAADVLESTMKNVTLGKQLNVTGVGDKAIWTEKTQQLSIQKGNYIFYVQVQLDPKQDLEVAKQLAGDVCKKI